MKSNLCRAIALAFVLSSAPVLAQETVIRFFGQPEMDFQSRDVKNQFRTIDSDPKVDSLGNITNPNFGQYVGKDTTYDSRSNFNTGNFVLFVTSQINEKLSALGEVSFYNRGNTFSFEVQRLMFRYYVNDYLSVRAGKMFTPIGFWNNQYTLGLVLQPTIQRPFAIRTGSEGGVLQFRDAGVQFEGDNITSAKIFYRLMLANGNNNFGSNDKINNRIAVTGNLGIEPVEGLKVSVSGMFDNFRKGQPNPNRTVAALPSDGTSTLLAASVSHMNPEKKVEFISELLYQTSKFNDTAYNTRNSMGFYVYGGYKLTDKITPYAMFDYAQAGTGTNSIKDTDPFFTPVPVRQQIITLGVRYKLASNFVVKLEYERYQAKTYYTTDFAYAQGIPPIVQVRPLTESDNRNRVRVQFAFAF
jgi:hypothetical protein